MEALRWVRVFTQRCCRLQNCHCLISSSIWNTVPSCTAFAKIPHSGCQSCFGHPFVQNLHQWDIHKHSSKYLSHRCQYGLRHLWWSCHGQYMNVHAGVAPHCFGIQAYRHNPNTKPVRSDVLRAAANSFASVWYWCPTYRMHARHWWRDWLHTRLLSPRQHGNNGSVAALSTTYTTTSSNSSSSALFRLLYSTCAFQSIISPIFISHYTNWARKHMQTIYLKKFQFNMHNSFSTRPHVNLN